MKINTQHEYSKWHHMLLQTGRADFQRVLHKLEEIIAGIPYLLITTQAGNSVTKHAVIKQKNTRPRQIYDITSIVK